MNILKTVLSAGLGLGLSLTGVEVLAAEESRSKASKPSMMKNLFSFKDKKYRPNISFSGFYGQNDGSYGSLDMLYPIHQKNDRLVFVDLRGLLKKSPVKEFNVGGGYRWLSSDKQKLYGAYGFFDRKMSENKNWFNQLTIGGELKTEQLKVLGLNTKGLSIGGNVYLPVGTKSYEVGRETTVTNAWAKPYQGDKFTISYGEMIDHTIDTEYALTGIDLEVGHAIPKVKGLKAYLGGYYFSHSKVDKVMGPRATLIYDLSSLMPKKLSLIDHLELETSIQNDKPRGTTWYAGLRLQMQLGSSKDKPKLKGLEKQLTAFVRRDLDVVDEQGREFDREITAEATWRKENGDPYVGKIVSTEAELNELAQGLDKDAGAVDIIGVKGTIEVTGDAYTNAATPAAIRLNYGQSITGQGLTFKANDGKTYTAKIVNSDQGIVGADPSLVGDGARGGITLKGANGLVGHLLRVYTKALATKADQPALEARVQRIEDLVLTVPKNEAGGTGLTSSVITNLTGKMGAEGNKDSFGHVVIDHIDANSNVRMFFDYTVGKTGKLRLTDSKFTISEMISGYGGMVHVTSQSDNDVVIESIDNNELVRMTSVGNARSLQFSYLNGPVVNNRFGSIRSGDANADDASGVYVANNIESGGSVSGNTFSSIEAADDARGVYVDNDLSGSVSGNTFSSIVALEAGNAYGVFVNNNLSGSLTDNAFTKIQAFGDNNACGLRIESGDLADAGSVSGNIFGLISSINGSAHGFYLINDLGGSFTGNEFTVSSTNGKADGIYQAGTSGVVNIVGISGNTFNVTAGGGNTAYGLSYDNANLNGGTVDAFKTSQNNVFGGDISEPNQVQDR